MASRVRRGIPGRVTNMRFSEHFNLTITKKDDWFDPHLTVDAKLFIDRLLLYIEKSKFLENGP
jgi:hypothetical protein